MSQATPGPWRRAETYRPESADHGVTPFAPYILDSTGLIVAAAMIGGFDDMAIVDANAELIAKAWLIPELLAALQAILDEPNDRAWEHARAVVAKATGA